MISLDKYGLKTKSYTTRSQSTTLAFPTHGFGATFSTPAFYTPPIYSRTSLVNTVTNILKY